MDTGRVRTGKKNRFYSMNNYSETEIIPLENKLPQALWNVLRSE